MKIGKRKAEKLFVDCITTSIDAENGDFHWDIFFQNWFKTHGQPCYFLFRKHLGVTNTQYVELFALLQKHSKSSVYKKGTTHLMFHTTEQIKGTLIDSLNSVLDVEESQREKSIRDFSKTYTEVFCATVAIDLFYCSTSVLLPPGLEVEIGKICAASGYIHSAGYAIFIRNIKKAKTKDLFYSLDKHLEKKEKETNKSKIPFVVYAHEDFSDFDSEAKEQIGRGIETTKIFVEKMSMGANRLSEVVDTMRDKFTENLEIPKPGSYLQEHQFNSSSCLWLISDRSLSSANSSNPGRDRYYICFEQIYRNENPFFIFDENKPAWKSHTTMPHSLTAALINSTGLPDGNLTLSDPFGGTGTTWLESLRLGQKSGIVCSDISPLTTLMTEDNLRFFLKNVAELQSLQSILLEFLEFSKDDEKFEIGSLQGSFQLNQSTTLEGANASYIIAKDLFEELSLSQPNEDEEYVFSNEFIKKMEKESFESRFLLYIFLRAKFRFQGGFKRRSTLFRTAVAKSIDELLVQIENFLEVKRYLTNKKITKKDGYFEYQGRYSKEIISHMFLMKYENFELRIEDEIQCKDARKIDENSVDVIICDPPYGFNTTESQALLAKLYSEFIEVSIRALKPGGHFIICLPAESYTGRDLPYCTKSSMISNQVLTKAEILGREVFLPAQSLPLREFSPPYYWEAEKALRRIILHFRIS